MTIEEQPAHKTSTRNASLDGLRGVAIALVVLFHAYVRWPEMVPFGDRFVHLPLLAQGKVGVQLFFLISGFVIYMTLDRSVGFFDFMQRRWLRLWPGMFAVSLFVFATAPLFTRPVGQPVLRDLLPGLLLIEQNALEWVIGSPQGILEQDFWTLFVEVKFYIVVSFLYFTVGSRWTLAALIGMFIAPMVVGRLPVIPQAVYATANFLDSWHWGWFAAGALYYKAQHRRWLLVPAFALSILAAIRMETGMTPAAVVVAVLFGLLQVSPWLQALLSKRVFVFFGVISYPLYLLHENMMVSMIGSVGRVAPWMPAALMPVLPIGVVVLLGWVFATHVEPAVRDAVKRCMSWPALSATR